MSGAVDITEADSNLRNAELIRDDLLLKGYDVYLTRNGEGQGPGAPLPLLVPVVLGAALATKPLFTTPVGGLPLRWLATLALYDLVFALIAFALFDFLLED